MIPKTFEIRAILVSFPAVEDVTWRCVTLHPDWWLALPLALVWQHTFSHPQASLAVFCLPRGGEPTFFDPTLSTHSAQGLLVRFQGTGLPGYFNCFATLAASLARWTTSAHFKATHGKHVVWTSWDSNLIKCFCFSPSSVSFSVMILFDLQHPHFKPKRLSDLLEQAWYLFFVVTPFLWPFQFSGDVLQTLWDVSLAQESSFREAVSWHVHWVPTFASSTFCLTITFLA